MLEEINKLIVTQTTSDSTTAYEEAYATAIWFWIFSPWYMIPYWISLPFVYGIYVIWMYVVGFFGVPFGGCDVSTWYGPWLAALIVPVCQYGLISPLITPPASS